jgi:hypothetical protein
VLQQQKKNNSTRNLTAGQSHMHGLATADSADAAQVDRVNVAKRFQTDPEASSRQIYPTVRDIATKLQSGVPCVTVDLPVDFSVDSLNGLFSANFRKVPKILCRKRTQKLQIVYITKTLLGISIIFSPVVSLCQALPKCRV